MQRTREFLLLMRHDGGHFWRKHGLRAIFVAWECAGDLVAYVRKENG